MSLRGNSNLRNCIGVHVGGTIGRFGISGVLSVWRWHRLSAENSLSTGAGSA